MTDETSELVALLRDEVNMPAGDNERLTAKIRTATTYVDAAIAGQTCAATASCRAPPTSTTRVTRGSA